MLGNWQWCRLLEMWNTNNEGQFQNIVTMLPLIGDGVEVMTSIPVEQRYGITLALVGIHITIFKSLFVILVF